MEEEHLSDLDSTTVDTKRVRPGLVEAEPSSQSISFPTAPVVMGLGSGGQDKTAFTSG